MNAMIGNSLLLSSEGYKISRSVRLRSSASAYFNRTPASAGNRKTWTWSGWVKRGALGSPNFTLFSRYVDANNFAYFRFTSNAGDELRWYEAAAGAAVSQRDTTQVLRDPSAFYHIVIAYDTTQAVAADRVKIYANGNQITAFATTVNRTQNADGLVNAAAAHQIGALNAGAFFDGYLTEINFIDGRTPNTTTRTVNGVTQTVLTELGEFNAVTGVWQPKAYTGTYGTNGFYLNFSDNSAATAAAIGKDYSGNGNNWTPNNISVTAGVTYDSMLDVPTPWPDGGNGRGNYFTLNPLSASGYTPYSDGNLKYTSPAVVALASVFTTTGGKWYYECTAGSIATPANFRFGFGAIYFANGNIFVGGSVIATVSSYTAGDIIGVATDSDANTVSFYKNNVLQGTYSASLNGSMSVVLAATAPDSASFNFGQRPFAYTPPSGFRALNTQNLPTPTILKGNQYFDVVTRSGSGANTTVSGLSMQPDFVWIKSRNTVEDHILVDAVRGVNKTLKSNATAAEAAYGSVSAFNADGYNVHANMNASGRTYVDWVWKEGATQGFDIVTYTGNGANRTIAHNLGVAPSMVIVKRRDSTGNWPVQHTSVAAANTLYLNLTNASAAAATVWNSTAPTSTVFSVGTSADVNANAGTYVAYLFAEVAGFSRFGSYTGNGSADGPFVFCGFRPRFVMVKLSSSAGTNWSIIDTSRNTYNVSNSGLLPNASNAEATLADIDVTANGFKVRSTSQNISAETYIYACFAENPFKYSLAR